MNASLAADFASGKGHRDENFPVGSFVLRRDVRAPVMAFYRFARAADDVADNPNATPEEKLRLLGNMHATLDGASHSDDNARALREALASTNVPLTHAHDLLNAFERDVTQLRYAQWDDLIDYCHVSAMPVGRFMLDIHGEPRTLWSQSDALCAALQIINHLQDCATDRRELDRVYLPTEILAAHGAQITDLDAPQASPALRAALRALTAQTRQLLDEARGFAAGVRDWRLGVEIAVITALAEDLLKLLMARDPLSDMVHHSKWRAGCIAIGATARRLVVGL